MNKEKEHRVVWGIIGCGDVAEVKSGPAFQKCEHSQLLAVMRRDGSKAKDFAKRHNVELWYDDAEELLKNQDINAVYIATPPSMHLIHAQMALEAGKDVYLEKPMVLSAKESADLCKVADQSSRKLVVAHYRRYLPMFLKIKEFIETNAIGNISYVDLKFLQPFDFNSKANWRLDPKISGGGYFHDIAPHQIDLMYHFFGEYKSACGLSVNQRSIWKVDDMVNGIIDFDNKIQFRGLWSFTIPEDLEEDSCVFYGEKGRIEFSFYRDELKLVTKSQNRSFHFKDPINIQQPFIQQTVNYFLGKRSNPCSVEEGAKVISIMEAFTRMKVLSE